MFDDDEGEDDPFQGSIRDPTEGLGPEIPSVRIPDTAESKGEAEANADLSSEVPRELFVAFWGLVVTLNLALFATSLGVMLAYFRGQLRLGGGLVALGVLAFAYAYYKYRRYHDRNTGDDSENGDGGDDDDGGGDGTDGDGERTD